MILTDFTFKDTGISIKIRKISPMLASDVAAAMPDPLPPEQEVDYGEPKGKVMERNFSDPAYQREVLEHRGRVFRAFRRVMVLRGIDPGSLPEGWQAEVQDYRAFMAAQTGKPVDEPDDLVVYILRIAVGSEEDLEELIRAITRRSQPTQEVIEQAKASFPGQV